MPDNKTAISSVNNTGEIKLEFCKEVAKELGALRTS